jgi:hypothetical protein
MEADQILRWGTSGLTVLRWRSTLAKRPFLLWKSRGTARSLDPGFAEAIPCAVWKLDVGCYRWDCCRTAEYNAFRFILIEPMSMVPCMPSVALAFPLSVHLSSKD